MKSYSILLSDLQAIVDYLQKQPWSEVNNLIVKIQKAVQEQDAQTKEPGDGGGNTGTPPTSSE
jgi:hypothetical protein